MIWSDRTRASRTSFRSEVVHRTAQGELHHLRSAKTVGSCELEGTMQTYNDLVELARICLKQAREAKSAFVSDEFDARRERVPGTRGQQ